MLKDIVYVILFMLFMVYVMKDILNFISMFI